MKTVSIIGGTGYTGSELLRLLSNHDEVEVVNVTSRKEAGKNLTDYHPQVRNLCNYNDLKFQNIAPEDIDSDIVFCATPHGASMAIVPTLHEKGINVIDLSGDYRFEDIDMYESWYGLKHSGKIDSAVYGLPELHREKIKKSKTIANPGCYPTGAILSMAPLVANDLVEDRIIFDSKSGVSGAGVEASQTTHFANVNENIGPYKITKHRHSPEIGKELQYLANKNLKVSFTPHLLPVTRGILTTAHSFLKEDISPIDVIEIYEEFYKDEFFIRIFEEGMPSLTGVRGTNFCDIGGFEIDQYGRIVVVSAIDNLVKGASGQAIQNMNIIMGFDEKEGLGVGGLKP
ncbi:N-acetyl-gamma-glutamyl-phosphate reductase [Methanococcus maripaludis]|uniref:N-acetyl-gamma-glutamyl-phosphate reductase n=1 Tax=Methanococcus maripaludis TaxID=39152 RepID=A0A7J9P8Q2_METMI|nr:N-acetyl-gamma-glutamyl-phosphate reductase [Methanococcus maripaludis]MBA2859086.1 N-acetyl-gamma-glutamyl-phosphate reductase [Methanococcus maripaludis]MBG0769330.1 N-acetyl-gamma-glutamyl-phosphate reductase [Methanococcus maripaludis]